MTDSGDLDREGRLAAVEKSVEIRAESAREDHKTLMAQAGAFIKLTTLMEFVVKQGEKHEGRLDGHDKAIQALHAAKASHKTHADLLTDHQKEIDLLKAQRAHLGGVWWLAAGLLGVMVILAGAILSGSGVAIVEHWVHVRPE